MNYLSTQELENLGIVADSMAIRLALIEKYRDNLSLAQKELIKIKRDGKKAGYLLREDFYVKSFTQVNVITIKKNIAEISYNDYQKILPLKEKDKIVKKI